MKIQSYPSTIANLQRKILHLEKRIRVLNNSLKLAEAKIERSIVFDTELKNDAQRKSQKQLSIETDEEYQKHKISLETIEDERSELQIQLELLHNQFSVAKLLMREAISYGIACLRD